jgi:hypothetical protein
MDQRAQWRLGNLRRAHVDVDFLKELHGISWPLEDELGQDFDSWLRHVRHEQIPQGSAPRYQIERFLASRGLESLRYMAARLGMQPQSLEGLLPRLPELGLRKTYTPYAQLGLIDKNLAEDLTRLLPGLRFRTFGDHDSFCEFLHGLLPQSLRGVSIGPLWCQTSLKMSAYENGYKRYASTWDNIQMEGLSGAHQVWLDFGKPMSLPPDRCSKLFYAQNRNILSGHLLGRGEPRDIEDYLRYMAAAAHG